MVHLNFLYALSILFSLTLQSYNIYFKLHILFHHIHILISNLFNTFNLFKTFKSKIRVHFYCRTIGRYTCFTELRLDLDWIS